MLAIAIEMPGGAMSRLRTHRSKVETVTLNGALFHLAVKGDKFTQETVLLEAASYSRQMKAWSNFEAYILLFEDEKEISREHVRT